MEFDEQYVQANENYTKDPYSSISIFNTDLILIIIRESRETGMCMGAANNTVYWVTVSTR